MRTVQISLPEPVLRQAQELATLESISVEQLLGLAVTQVVSTWSAERSIGHDRKSSSRKRFLEMLQQALDAENTGPEQLPPGSR